MNEAEAREALQRWREGTSQRDSLFRAARDAGITKHQIHQITGVARTTIDRILGGDAMPGETETLPACPWQAAEIHEGTIPQQAILYPRPVILECQDCMRVGYWYPDESRIDTRSRMCPEGPVGWRPYHRWTVESWNGHQPERIVTSFVQHVAETGEQS